MSNAIFPISQIRGLTFPVLRRPTFQTTIQKSPNRYEVRLQQSSNPIWQWEMEFDYLYDYSQLGQYTDLKTLMGFFLQRYGAFDDFLFNDPDDNAVGGGYPGSYAAAQALPLVSSGGVFYSPLQRNLGGFNEDVTDLQPAGLNDHSALNVWANGNLQVYGLNYTIPPTPGLAIGSASYMGLYLQWATPPTPPIRAAFNFFFRVRFDGDELDFEKFMSQLWAMGGQHGKGGKGSLPLISARPAIA